MNTLEPLYQETTEALGWSPADLSPPFDLAACINASYNNPPVRKARRGRRTR